MNGRTPGPWVAYEIAPEDPGWGACEIWPAENDRKDDEGVVRPVATMVMGVENARLIAAAPELLEALKEMVEAGEFEDWDNRCEAQDNARRVIARAEGL